MQPTLIDQGLILMLYGMGTVFVFLTMLVFATSFMSYIITRFGNDLTEQADDKNASESSALSSPAPSPAILEAIKLAIAKYRSR